MLCLGIYHVHIKSGLEVQVQGHVQVLVQVKDQTIFLWSLSGVYGKRYEIRKD